MKIVLLIYITILTKKCACNVCQDYVNSLLKDIEHNDKDTFTNIKEEIRLGTISDEKCKTAKFVEARIYGEIPICNYGRNEEFIENSKRRVKLLQRYWCFTSCKIS